MLAIEIPAEYNKVLLLSRPSLKTKDGGNEGFQGC